MITACKLHKPVLSRAPVSHPSTVHFSTPPCAMHKPVLSRAPVSHPSTKHFSSPPCNLHKLFSQLDDDES